MVTTAPQKTIVCYGDSNTWGIVPGSLTKRWAPEVRWPGVVQKILGLGYRVIEEGLRGRNSSFDDPLAPPLIELNGKKLLATIIDTHKPVEYVVLFLGTNDLKYRLQLAPRDIAHSLELLAGICANPVFGSNNQPPQVLVICPPPILEVPENHGPQFQGGAQKSLHLHEEFAVMAKRSGVNVLYAKDFVTSDPADGIHLNEASHAALGKAVADWIRAHS